ICSDPNHDSDNPTTPTEAYPVTFDAVMESLNLTKSIFAFPEGRFAVVYAYNQGNTTKDAPVAKASYETKSAGILSPVSQKIYLPNGEYDFYSVATNSTTNKTPDFTNGISSPLSNGIDYLWWRVPNYSIESAAANINIVYKHSCSQVVIKLSSGNGVTINSVTSAKITPPVTNSTMDLSSGIIPPATTLSNVLFDMGVAQNVCQATVLPLQTNTPMQVTFEIVINNEASARNYQVNIPIPDGKLIAGNSYLFKAVVDANTITFPEVSVIAWIVVNEQGTPLYPSEIK
ncbi:MAG: fimbrillin family protein, partial [Bacteroidales bacterium]